MKYEGRLSRPRFMVPFLWCIASIAIFWEFASFEDAGQRFARFIVRGPGYRSYAAPLTSTDRAVLRTANLLKQGISWRGERFLLTAIDGTQDRLAVHDPLNYFCRAGWEVKAQQSLPIRGGTAQWLRLQRPVEERGRQTFAETEAVYFFSTGERRYVEPVYYWGEAIRRRLTLGTSGPEPVLIVLQPLSSGKQNAPDWQHILTEFIPLLEL